MNNNFLKKYAELIVKIGVNIQDNQILVVNSPIECAEFTRSISEIAYEQGARDVVVNWSDEKLSKIKYLNGRDDIFDDFPEWRKELYTSYAREDAAFLSIHASDPELMKDVDTGRIMRANKAANTALREYRGRIMSDKNVWSVVSVPTRAWSRKVFPNVSEGEAVEKLWDSIFETVRVKCDDPIGAWEDHKKNLKKRMKFLNENNFKYLEYRNGLGTDLKIELPEGHIWLGGSSFSPGGTEFMANIPTEEVYTLPLKNGVNGRVFSSKPLNYNGNLIDNFSIVFKDGKIVDFTAEHGFETLKHIIGTDEGSHYLGEVALVPFNSPISNSNILFYNTLFDENASCHLAIGEAYPVCIKGGGSMSRAQLESAGVNNSLEHVDFMIGTEDLNITGTTQNGDKIEIFKNGNFSF